MFRSLQRFAPNFFSASTDLVTWYFEARLPKRPRLRVCGHFCYDVTAIATESATYGYGADAYHAWTGLKALEVDFTSMSGDRFTLDSLARTSNTGKGFVRLSFNSNDVPISLQFFSLTPYSSHWGMTPHEQPHELQCLKITDQRAEVQVGSLNSRHAVALTHWSTDLPKLKTQAQVERTQPSSLQICL